VEVADAVATIPCPPRWIRAVACAGHLFYTTCGEGDNRGFDSAAGLADSRATLILDFEKGQAYAGFQHSCLDDGTCKDAFDAYLQDVNTADCDPELASLVADSLIEGPAKNSFLIFATEDGFSIHFNARSSVDPSVTQGFGPHINAKVDTALDGSRFSGAEIDTTVGSRQQHLRWRLT